MNFNKNCQQKSLMQTESLSCWTLNVIEKLYFVFQLGRTVRVCYFLELAIFFY